MAYEIFNKTVNRPGSPPTLNMAPSGRLGLNKAAAEQMKSAEVEKVLLLWDADSRRIALKPTRKKDLRTFRVTYGKAGVGTGAAIAAKSFCDYTGLDYKGSTGLRFQLEWNDEESIFETRPIEQPAGQQKSEVYKQPSRRTA